MLPGGNCLSQLTGVIGLYVHACVFDFVVGFLATQGKVTWGQSPLAGVIAT